MQQAHKPSIAPISTARPVPRKMTMAGGFQVNTAGMPEKQSGSTSAGGVVPSQAEDAAAEAKGEALALISRLAEIVADIDAGRFIQADESARSGLRRLDNIRGYVQHLARAQRTPFKCPRCQTNETSDSEGQCFCPGCVMATFGRPRF